MSAASLERSVKAPIWRAYLERYRPHRVRLSVLLLCSLLPTLLVVPFVLIFRELLDHVVPSRDLMGLYRCGALLVGLQLTNLGVALWIRHLGLSLTKRLITDLRRDLLVRLYDLPRSFYTQADLSKLHTTLVQDVERVDVMSNVLVAQFLPSAIASVALTGVLFFMNWRLAAVVVVLGAAIVALNTLLRKAVRSRNERFRSAFEAMSKGFYFVVHSVDLTRTQTAEKFEVDRQTQSLERLREAATDLAWLDTFHSQLHSFLAVTTTVVILVLGGQQVVQGGLSLGALMAFYLAVSQMSNQLRNAQLTIPQMLLGIRALEALAPVLEEQQSQPYHGKRGLPSLGQVQVRGVRFRYHPEAPLLEGVDLTIERGRHLALMGPNGSGKSTLLHLLAGFYKPDAGEIMAGGMTYSQLDMTELRRRMAFVPQHAALFHGTVRENIAYGCPDATEEEIQQAARSAMAAEFIQSLSEGYETFVGDRGVRLSGGQRQRIAIARALLRRPELLVLDEPTNHLDEAAVGLLMERIRQLSFKPAVLVISHEPRVLDFVDEAWTIEEGRAVPVAMGVRSVMR